MKDLSPKPGDLDPIELASRDGTTALQLTRMKKSLAHAYANVVHYKAVFDAAAALARGIKANIGISAKVVASEPGTVVRSEGMALRVVDKRRKD